MTTHSTSRTDKNMKEYIPIVFAADDGYAMPTGVAIASLCNSKKNDTKYRIYLIAPHLSNDNIDKLKSYNSDNCKIEIIFAENLLQNKASTLEKVTNTDYYRLMLDSILPNEDKVISLDGDLLVFEDLTELYNIELGENYIGGCYFRPHDIYNRKYVQEVLTLNEGKRINIGVMLMNLKKLREDNIQKQMIAKIGCFDIMSEDIINYICKDKIKQIPLKFNYNLHFYKYKNLLKNDPVYSAEEYKTAKQKPAIFHYTLEKPWKVDVIHRQKDWIFYKNLSSYKNVDLNIKKKSLLERIFFITHESSGYKKHKVITICGIKLKFRED